MERRRELCKGSGRKLAALSTVFGGSRSTLTIAMGNKSIPYVMVLQLMCFCVCLRHSIHHSSPLGERLLFSVFFRHPILADVSTDDGMTNSLDLYFICYIFKPLEKSHLYFLHKCNMSKDFFSNITVIFYTVLSYEIAHPTSI